MPLFRDIPQFTRDASYRVNVGWSYLENLLSDWGNDFQVVLEPDFQRAHVWDDTKRSRYVEFVLRGGRSSRDLQWNCTTWGKGYNTPVVLVDGLQRLTAVRKFLSNEIPIFNGYYFADYTDRLRIAGPDFVFCVNNLATRAELLQWYIDLNAGGVAHTEEEIRKVKLLLSAEG